MISTETSTPTLFEMPCPNVGHEQGKIPARPRIKKINRDQMVLKPTDVEELIPADHAARAIWEIVGQMDLSAYYDDIGAVEGKAGREAFDPRLMISLWLYACKEGVGSAREIGSLCITDPAFQWLTGLKPINYHTLSDFRVKNKEGLDELFTSILGILSSEGLIDLMRVMHDGTKVKARAKGASYRREDRIKKHLDLARDQVAAMGDPREAAEVGPRMKAARERAAREKEEKLALALEELKKIKEAKRTKLEKSQARASETDPESRMMKDGHGRYGPSYNVQISTDGKEKAIVGVGVSQSQNDSHELTPAVDRIEDNVKDIENMKESPDQMVVDGGYANRENIVEMERRGINLVGPVKEKGSPANVRDMDPAFRLTSFQYNEEENQYQCPAGNIVRYKKQKKMAGATEYEYEAKLSDCLGCPFKEKCCPNSAKSGRTLTKLIEDPVVVDYRKKMGTEEAKEIYKLRGPTAEFPNAWIKDKIGLRQFHVRGKLKVEMEATWACLTYNIQLWIRLVWKPRQALAFSSG